MTALLTELKTRARLRVNAARRAGGGDDGLRLRDCLNEVARAAGFHAGSLLLPYRRQFVVVNDPFIRELGLDPADPAWAQAGRDLAQAYGGPAWLALARLRLKAAPATFAWR